VSNFLSYRELTSLIVVLAVPTVVGRGDLAATPKGLSFNGDVAVRAEADNVVLTVAVVEVRVVADEVRRGATVVFGSVLETKVVVLVEETAVGGRDIGFLKNKKSFFQTFVTI
jgi:hypothetical protein